MSEDLVFEELDFWLETPQVRSQNEVQETVPPLRPSTNKRMRLAERIADVDVLVRQVKQLQANLLQLKDIQRTAGEVTKLYQHEKQQRMKLESRINEQSERIVELEKQLDAQELSCGQMQEQLNGKTLPVDAVDMITAFIELSQRLGHDSLFRGEIILLRKLKDYCKSAKISIPTMKSPRSKRSKASIQVTQTTQTDTLPDLPVNVPRMCSIAVQSENLVTTRNQGTQHKNMTTTRGTTTASFIQKHDVGTIFPEPKPALSVQQILEKMINWKNPYITPLSPILSEPEVLRTESIGTCTDLCNVLRQIDYLPEQPKELKQSNSRPPSRSNVKDELGALGGYGHHMAKELLHFLPQSQSILTNLPPHVFEEIWQVMGQMLLVLLQRRSTSSSLATPMPTSTAPTVSQADFSSWLDALYESSINQTQTSSNEHAELEVPAEEPATCNDMGTVPTMAPPPEIALELTPIRLPPKPKVRAVFKPIFKAKPKKKIRRVNLNLITKKETSASDAPTETAVQFLRNLNMFKNSNCDNLDNQLDAEERQLLKLTSSEENKDQHCEKVPPKSTIQTPQHTDQFNMLIGSDEDSDDEQSSSLQKEQYSTPNCQISLTCQDENKLFDLHNEQHPTFKDREGQFQSFNRKGQSEEDLSQSSSTYSTESDDEEPWPFKDQKDPPKSTSTASSRKDQIKLLFDTDLDSDDEEPSSIKDEESQLKSRNTKGQSEEDLSQSSSSSSFESDDEEPPTFEDENYPPKITPLTLSNTDQNKFILDIDGHSDNEQSQSPKYEQTCQQMQTIAPDGNESDVDSEDSSCLVIDDVKLECNVEKDNEPVKLSSVIAESILPSALGKRKRSSSSLEQPVEKRITRSQAKKLSSESEDETTIDNFVTKKSQSSCNSLDSPMSPVADASCEDSEPIDIPLEETGGKFGLIEPKALLSFVVNEVKADVKQRGQQKQLPNKSQMKQLKLALVNYLKNSAPLDSMCIQLITEDETAAIDVIIAVFKELQDGNALQLLMTLVREVEGQNHKFIERFMNSLEQRLFCLKKRLQAKLAQQHVRLYLQLTSLQATLTVPGQSYVNPARLLLAKILYFYNTDMTLLVLEVLCHFPTVLPHREDRDYDNSDALITVIKHLLMSHKYDMQDPQGPDRTLLSKLRFEYHFQPFEPTKPQVIENLVEKLKAGRLHHLSYAFALFCRRSVALHVIKAVLEERLLPLANSYCDMCVQSDEYDERMECLLQSVSMIVKQVRLDNKIDISNYIAIFKRILVAVPRPGVQQAAVQAILRTQRFGFNYSLDALNSYRPSYPLNSMTRAMMWSFAERRRQYQGSFKVARGQNQKTR